MRSPYIAERILSQVLPPDRAASTVGDWMEDAAQRGDLWFWASVFRTVLARVWRDFAESPMFLVSLAMRGWLYSGWLILVTFFVGVLGCCIVVGAGLLTGFLVSGLHGHPSFPPLVGELLGSTLALAWIGWCEFKTGCWIARHAPGKELAAGIAACVLPTALASALGLLAEHFWGPQINRFIVSHPYDPDSLPATLPSEIFLLAGILWSRHKSIRTVAS